MTGDGTIVAGRRVADRYRLVGQRSANEWDAVDETLRRNVVVQLLDAEADPSATAHFAAEAKALAGLPHRNVVATYDFGVDADGSSFRVDELPDGEPLDPSGVDDARRVSYATQIAKAIAEAHNRGLVHGSLTSASVLVHEDGRVKVCGIRLPTTTASDHMRRADAEAVVNLVAALAPGGSHAMRDMAMGWRAHDPPASVAHIVNALVSLPDDADTVALVDPDPTPVGGLARRKRRLPVGALISLVVAAAVTLVVVSLLPGDGSPDDVSGPERALKMVASSFDPEVRPPTENEPEAPLAVDGNPATAWMTDRYHSARFGNLKSGVGIVLLSEAGPAAYGSLRIRTPRPGWSYAVYVAESRAANLAGWGQPIARGTAATGDFTVALGGAKGGAVLLWITDPGPGNQARIAELDVSGRV